MNRCALIFGVGGQDGAYLSELLLGKGYAVHGTSRDPAGNRFEGLRCLGIIDRIKLHSVDPTDFHAVRDVVASVKPSEIYNLSAQSSVALSFEQPAETLSSIGQATVNLLEAVRSIDSGIRFYNASSSEMFGDTGAQPATETTAFRPHSPYGVSKAASHWLVENYRKGYGLYACSGICFNHESSLRSERFVTHKIVRSAIAIKRKAKRSLALGNLSIVRDWGWAPEYVDAMWRMLQQPEPTDFIIATGKPSRLEDFVDVAFSAVGLKWQDHVDYDSSLLRPHDLQYSLGCADKAAKLLNWSARLAMPDIVARLVEAELERR